MIIDIITERNHFGPLATFGNGQEFRRNFLYCVKKVSAFFTI